MMLSVYKSFLDIEASAFSIKVNDMCFIRRQQGKARYFGNYYYPAMAVCCCNLYGRSNRLSGSFATGRGN